MEMQIPDRTESLSAALLDEITVSPTQTHQQQTSRDRGYVTFFFCHTQQCITNDNKHNTKDQKKMQDRQDYYYIVHYCTLFLKFIFNRQVKEGGRGGCFQCNSHSLPHPQQPPLLSFSLFVQSPRKQANQCWVSQRLCY